MIKALKKIWNNHFVNNTEKEAILHSLYFAVVGISGISIIYYVLFSAHNIENVGIPYFTGIVFLLISSLFLFILLRKNANVVKDMRQRLDEQKVLEKYHTEILNFVLDNTADCIYWFNLEGKIIYANNTLCKTLGYTKTELLNLHVWDIDRDFYSIEKVVMTRKKQNNLFLSKLQRKNGEEFLAQIAASFVSNHSGEFICAFARDISEQKRKEEIIQTSLKEKEVLLKEVHHRVKNNLQIISSILSLQNRRNQDADSKKMLENAGSRIYAISLLHEMIYKSENISNVNMKEYCENLVKNIKNIYDIQDNIEIVFDV
ncbi:MAG: sensor histidine kinase, partial [Campylobacteraceae bacterium]